MTKCPICAEAMSPALVVCWTCYRSTERLSVGTWKVRKGYRMGLAFVTRHQLAEWDAARDARCSAH